MCSTRVQPESLTPHCGERETRMQVEMADCGSALPCLGSWVVPPAPGVLCMMKAELLLVVREKEAMHLRRSLGQGPWEGLEGGEEAGEMV